mmetsp:Transcript_20854/g.38707  ORF Transcript_20854/g.38707 Transcript_20854/m.38707 type:complete len:139 (-) Transcript_20854:1074-1490(-)
MKDFVKLLFRLLHIGAGCFVAGNVAGDFLYSPRTDQGYLKAVMILCGVLFVSGVVNSILLRPSKIFKDKHKDRWMSFIVLKVVLFVGLTPLPEKILGSVGVNIVPYRLTIHFALIVAILIVSSIAKQFRDAKTITKQA